MKKLLQYTFLVFVLNFISCNSNKELSSYPNFNSAQYKKYEYQANNRNIQHPISNFLKTTSAICSTSSASTNHIHNVETVFSEEFIVKNNIHLISRESFTQENDQLNLTASISNEAFIRRHNSRPDTNLKNNLPSVDTSAKTNISAKPIVVENQENHKGPKKNEREVFAILSLAFALLVVPALILTLPALTFMLAIAAIVFGTLGLKSKRKKMATVGLVLGIIAAFFYLIAIIYVLTTPIM